MVLTKTGEATTWARVKRFTSDQKWGTAWNISYARNEVLRGGTSA